MDGTVGCHRVHSLASPTKEKSKMFLVTRNGALNAPTGRSYKRNGKSFFFATVDRSPPAIPLTQKESPKDETRLDVTSTKYVTMADAGRRTPPPILRLEGTSLPFEIVRILPPHGAQNDGFEDISTLSWEYDDQEEIYVEEIPSCDVECEAGPIVSQIHEYKLFHKEKEQWIANYRLSTTTVAL